MPASAFLEGSETIAEASLPLGSDLPYFCSIALALHSVSLRARGGGQTGKCQQEHFLVGVLD